MEVAGKRSWRKFRPNVHLVFSEQPQCTGPGRKCRIGGQPGQPAPHLSRQTDRPQEEGRVMIAGWGDASPCGGNSWHSSPAARGWTVVCPDNRAHVHRVVLGGPIWKALNFGGLITQHLLSSEGGFLALKALTGVASMPIPRGDSFFCFLGLSRAL